MENKKSSKPRKPVIKDKCYIALCKDGKYYCKCANKWDEGMYYFLEKVYGMSKVRLIEGEYNVIKDSHNLEDQNVLKILFDNGRRRWNADRDINCTMKILTSGPKLYSGYYQGDSMSILKTDLDKEYNIGDVITVSLEDFYLENLIHTNRMIGKKSGWRFTKRGYLTNNAKLYTLKQYNKLPRLEKKSFQPGDGIS